MAQAENTTQETSASDVGKDTVETKATEAAVTTQADGGNDGGNDATTQQEEKKDSIYSDRMLPRIEVGNGFRSHRPLNFYVDRARRILRTEETLEVTGHGLRVSKACTLVEVLKRQKIAEIKSVSTGMETQPYFANRQRRGRNAGDAMWSPPTTVIRFTLSQGEFAKYVSDYHQRKVIEIFENADTDNDGKLSFDEIDSLDMASAFYSNDEQILKGKEFLSKNGEPDKSLNLPNFIKYASILIHPLLKDDLFKQALSEKYNIVTGDQGKKNSSDDDE